MIKEIVGKKLGMTQVFDDNGNLIGVTILKIEPVLTLEKIEYPKGPRVKVGCFKVGEKKEKKIKRPCAGYFKKLKVASFRMIREVMPDAQTEFEAKKEVGVEIFQETTYVNVQARSKGKGFQGGMRRHNWRGQPATHGSTTHRRVGSVGASAYPSKIVKGHRMPGHMGNRTTTVKNLRVVKVDTQGGLLFVEGSVPGSTGSLVVIKKR